MMYDFDVVVEVFDLDVFVGFVDVMIVCFCDGEG